MADQAEWLAGGRDCIQDIGLKQLDSFMDLLIFNRFGSISSPPRIRRAMRCCRLARRLSLASTIPAMQMLGTASVTVGLATCTVQAR